MQPNEFPEWFSNRYKHTSSFFSGIALLAIDLLVIMLSIGTSFFILNLINQSFINFRSFVTYWVYLPAFIAVFYAARLYPGIVLSPADEVRRFSVTSTFCFTGIALSIAVETDGRGAISFALLCAVPISCVFLPAGRQVARLLFSKRKFWGVPAVIYGFDENKNVIVERLLRHPELGYKPVLIIDPNKTEDQDMFFGIPVMKPSAEIHQIIKNLKITTAILIEKADDSVITDNKLYSVIMHLYRYTVAIPYNQHIRTISSSVRDFNGIIGFSTTHNLTRKGSLFLKRCMDLLLLLIAAVPTLLITAIIAVAIKISSPGPVFYGHKRVGKNGKPITTWKFRSMITNSQEVLERILATNPEMRAEWEKDRKFKNDPRVTKIGKLLRNTSLDELPQLWNILCGNMSFIGPRPVTEPELEKYGANADFILSVKPGLSGMWQISGRSDTGYEERILLDTYYIQNWSIWLDIWIIIKTVWVVLKGKGAY
ncbi:undecaprenyl-phosphate galactose phosphotransferase WbaP [Treponema brennaborense]|uniref:Undecaprenyl-phosphate galactose phosphotransferase, WbaP n=1 Tax=Treponema brennaborense (strain DSM 12168 / CIP 105900 / DD5/3) TaxID=906968 RepID=F4LLF7_TREBD|nr:undecaprenyl-phosphate galactose phosphotransferase WbaP [Treponema brennaborense]AEE16621.1 Undecaprenyl-phosphate galactose phosphotransferase, WbaP [Treponema brennaborense DSM 12168]